MRCAVAGFDCVLAKDFFEGCPHDGGIGVDTGPVANTDDALIDEHAQSVDDFTAFGSCIANEIGGGRVGNDVGHDHSFAKGAYV